MEQADGNRKRDYFTAPMLRSEAIDFVLDELTKRKIRVLGRIKRGNRLGDIECTNLADTRRFRIKVVKSNRIRVKVWTLNHHQTTEYSDSLFYVFVKFNKTGDYPEFYVVPSKVVTSFTENDSKRWMNTLSKEGQQHQNIGTRKFLDTNEGYLNRWDLLELE